MSALQVFGSSKARTLVNVPLTEFAAHNADVRSTTVTDSSFDIRNFGSKTVFGNEALI